MLILYIPKESQASEINASVRIHGVTQNLTNNWYLKKNSLSISIGILNESIVSDHNNVLSTWILKIICNLQLDGEHKRKWLIMIKKKNVSMTMMLIVWKAQIHDAISQAR